MVDLFWFGTCHGCFPLEYWKKEKPVLAFGVFFHWDCSLPSWENATVFPLFHFLLSSLFLVCRNVATSLPHQSDLEPPFPSVGQPPQNYPARSLHENCQVLSSGKGRQAEGERPSVALPGISSS